MEEGSLTRLSRQIKNEWLLIFSICIGASLLSFIVYSSFIKKPTQVTQGTPYKSNIFPGITTEGQVKSKLGVPLKTESSGSASIYYYPTTNNFRQDEIEFSNQKVSVVKEQVIGNEKGKLVDYSQSFGQSEAIVYGEYAELGPGYFWGSKGVLVFANPVDGTIFEIWYFQPQTLQDFLSNNTEITKDIKSSEF